MTLWSHVKNGAESDGFFLDVRVGSLELRVERARQWLSQARLLPLNPDPVALRRSARAAGLGGNAVIASGRRLETAVQLPAVVPVRAGAGGLALRVLRTVRTHLEPRSAVLHNSLRLAVGLAASVYLARTLGFSHAFWVVLGTLQVLRTSAFGTGRTTVQALAGNVLGVLVGGLFAALAGNHPVLMWIALPLGVFVAAYAATTVGFLLSQAAFTVNLIIVFNLISPAGWQVGLVRIEGVAVGAAVSVVAGVLLWPRGARGDLARSVSSFYRATASYLQAAFDQLLGSEVGNDIDDQRRRAVRARDRAGESLQVLLSERGAQHLGSAGGCRHGHGKDPGDAGRGLSELRGD